MAGTMFERYGGFASVSKIVMSLYDKVLDSDITGPYFEEVDMRRRIDHQTKFVSQVMGGPAVYTNEQLEQLHEHLDITDDAFKEVMTLFEETLEDFEFESDDIRSIMRDLESRKPWIVSQDA
jgi:hemoglobin